MPNGEALVKATPFLDWELLDNAGVAKAIIPLHNMAATVTALSSAPPSALEFSALRDTNFVQYGPSVDFVNRVLGVLDTCGLFTTSFTDFKAFRKGLALLQVPTILQPDLILRVNDLQSYESFDTSPTAPAPAAAAELQLLPVLVRKPGLASQPQQPRLLPPLLPLALRRCAGYTATSPCTRVRTFWLMTMIYTPATLVGAS